MREMKVLFPDTLECARGTPVGQVVLLAIFLISIYIACVFPFQYTIYCLIYKHAHSFLSVKLNAYLTLPFFFP